MIQNQVRAAMTATALPNWFRQAPPYDLTPAVHSYLQQAELAHQLASRIDDKGFFPQRKKEIPTSAAGFCGYVRALWEGSSGQTLLERWNAFSRAMDSSILGVKDNSGNYPPHTARWGMRKLLASKTAFSKGSWPVGTYLSSCTIRHVHKMFLYPFECMPVEKMLIQAQRDLGDLWKDVILHQDTVIKHTGPFLDFKQLPRHPSLFSEPPSLPAEDTVWNLARKLSIHARQDGVLEGYDVLLSTPLFPTSVFPGLWITPYRHHIKNVPPPSALTRPSDFVIHPEYACRYSVNFHEPRILRWWAKQVALELVTRAQEVAALSFGRAHLSFVKFDNVTPKESLIDRTPKGLYRCTPASPLSEVWTCDDGAYQWPDEWEIRFVPTAQQYHSFFAHLRFELDRLADQFALDGPLADTLRQLRFLPNIPGSPLSVERRGLSSVVEGYFAETLFDPEWPAILVPETLELLRSWMEQGKWLFLYPQACDKASYTTNIQREHQYQSAAALRLLLEAYPPPATPPPAPAPPRPPSQQTPNVSPVPSKFCYQTERPELYQGQYVFPSSPQAPGLPGWMPGEPRRVEACKKAAKKPRSPSSPRPDRLPDPRSLPGLFLLQFVPTDPCTQPARWRDLLAPLGSPLRPTQLQRFPFSPSVSLGVYKTSTLFPDDFEPLTRNAEDSLLFGTFQEGRLFLSFLSLGCWSFPCLSQSQAKLKTLYTLFCASSSRFSWRSGLLPSPNGSVLPRPLPGLPLPALRVEYPPSLPLPPSSLHTAFCPPFPSPKP